MVALDLIYGSDPDGTVSHSTILKEDTCTAFLDNVASKIKVDPAQLKELFGGSLIGLAEDQAIAMVYQLLSRLDTDDSTPELDLEGKSLKAAVATDLGVTDTELPDVLKNMHDVFAKSTIEFEGATSDTLDDDVVKINFTTENKAALAEASKEFKIPEAKRTELFGQFDSYSVAYDKDTKEVKIEKPAESNSGDNGGDKKKPDEGKPDEGKPDEGKPDEG